MNKRGKRSAVGREHVPPERWCLVGDVQRLGITIDSQVHNLVRRGNNCDCFRHAVRVGTRSVRKCAKVNAVADEERKPVETVVGGFGPEVSVDVPEYMNRFITRVVEIRVERVKRCRLGR